MFLQTMRTRSAMSISKENRNIFFIGLAKDCARSLATCLHGITPLFYRYKVSGVIIENGSEDGTRHLLNQWAMNVGGLKFTNINGTLPQERYEKMAFLRNIGLECARKAQPDIVVMADLDMVSFQGLRTYEPCKTHSIETSVGLMPTSIVKDWYPSKPQGEYAYYDLLALEYKNGTRPSWTGNDGISYPNTSVPILKSQTCEVAEGFYNSSFGGLGFYRWDVIKDLWYEGGDCEHVKFNRTAGGTYINPNLVTLYATIP